MTTGAATATPISPQTAATEPTTSARAPQPSPTVARNGRGPVSVLGRARDDGSARVGADVRASRTGLRLRPDMSFDAWSALGARIAGRAKSTSWWLGDWIVFGERHYGSRYRIAVQATGLDYQTLRNYAAVARRFGVSS